MKQGERIALLAFELGHGETVTAAYIESRFGVSRATAKRDAALLDRIINGRELPPGFQKRRLIRAAPPPHKITERGRLVSPLGAD